MITIEKNIRLPESYPLERLGRPEEILFFDIETTGFSGERDRLYLIGCLCRSGDGWRLTQWFADTADAEPELLRAFFGYLKDFRVLVHFNGDGFDLPFLLKRCGRLGLVYDFSAVESVDIYKKIRPYRRLLGLESLKQKAVECFLGICRQDRYSGGQLIQVYEDYLVTHEQSLYDLLILHNEDDLKGMPAILPVLNYPDFLERELLLADKELLLREEACLRLACESDVSLPVPFRGAWGPVAWTAGGRRMTFTVRLFEGTLKHFYPNYKDYYYLIYEDTAVHKSVGGYVAREARTRATAKTCYTKKEGRFLPQFGQTFWEPVMKAELKDKLTYAALEDVCLEDEECLLRYCRLLISQLTGKPADS